MNRLKKALLALAGLLLILWGYYQLFSREPERTFLNEEVSVYTDMGIISGTLLSIEKDSLSLRHNGTMVTIPKDNLIRINNVTADEYENKRVLSAMFATMAGGVLLWIALFFL